MGAFSLAAGAAILPILLIVGVVVAVLGAIAALVALLVPAIPFILLGLMIWALMRKKPVSCQLTVDRCSRVESSVTVLTLTDLKRHY